MLYPVNPLSQGGKLLKILEVRQEESRDYSYKNDGSKFALQFLKIVWNLVQL